MSVNDAGQVVSGLSFELENFLGLLGKLSILTTSQLPSRYAI